MYMYEKTTHVNGSQTGIDLLDQNNSNVV